MLVVYNNSIGLYQYWYKIQNNSTILQYMVVTLQNNVTMFRTTWNDYINSHLWSVTLHNHTITHQNNVI